MDVNIDFTGIDNYWPLSGRRDGFGHADAALVPAIYDRVHLLSNISGGHGFDRFYASTANRALQTRTAVADGAAAKPWLLRVRDPRAR